MSKPLPGEGYWGGQNTGYQKQCEYTEPVKEQSFFQTNTTSFTFHSFGSQTLPPLFDPLGPIPIRSAKSEPPRTPVRGEDEDPKMPWQPVRKLPQTCVKEERGKDHAQIPPDFMSDAIRALSFMSRELTRLDQTNRELREEQMELKRYMGTLEKHIVSLDPPTQVQEHHGPSRPSRKRRYDSITRIVANEQALTPSAFIPFLLENPDIPFMIVKPVPMSSCPDDLKLVCLGISPNVSRVVGWKPEELIGAPESVLLPGDPEATGYIHRNKVDTMHALYQARSQGSRVSRPASSPSVYQNPAGESFYSSIGFQLFLDENFMPSFMLVSIQAATKRGPRPVSRHPYLSEQTAKRKCTRQCGMHDCG